MNKKKPLPDVEVRACVKEKMQECMRDQDFHTEIIKGKRMVCFVTLLVT